VSSCVPAIGERRNGCAGSGTCRRDPLSSRSPSWRQRHSDRHSYRARACAEQPVPQHEGPQTGSSSASLQALRESKAHASRLIASRRRFRRERARSTSASGDTERDAAGRSHGDHRCMAKSRNANRSKRRPKRNSTSVHQDSVDALTALDLVRGRLSEIDALAAAADDRLDAIPGGALDPEQRRRLGQLVELVAATARASRDAVEYGERLAAAAMRSRTTQ